MGVYIGSTPLLWALTVSFILGTAYSMEVWYQLEHHFGMIYLSVHHDFTSYYNGADVLYYSCHSCVGSDQLLRQLLAFFLSGRLWCN